MRKFSILAPAILILALPAVAQLEIPRASQQASITQTIGTTDITVDYHRPGVKGRAIWGSLVPFDQPWRMGANEATTITFSGPVKFEGQEVPAGKYSLFAIPGKDRWTIVVNKDPNQWGAYGYDQSKDQLRATVSPMKAPLTEWMRFTIDPVAPDSALVTLNWETVAVPMRIDVDVSKGVWSDVEASLKKSTGERAELLANAANWALDSGQRLDEGLQWVDQSIATSGENVFNLWTRARLLHKLGRAGDAAPVIDKAMTMAKAGNMPADFMNLLDGTSKAIRADIR